MGGKGAVAPAAPVFKTTPTSSGPHTYYASKSVTMLMFKLRQVQRHDYTVRHMVLEASNIKRTIENASDEQKVKMSLLFGGPVTKVDYGRIDHDMLPELTALIAIQGGGAPMDHAEKELNRERLQALQMIFPGLLTRVKLGELI